MAAKLLQALADDNQDLQKQIGCMTGLFQIFDRQHALTGRRLSHKRLPPPPPSDDSCLNNGSSEREAFNIYRRASETEMYLNKNSNEQQGISTDSARPSFSSSCSSTFSLEGNKPAQPEASSFDRIIFPETPSRDAILAQPATFPYFGRKSLDLQEVVKDSMHREARGLSVKTTSKEEVAGNAIGHKDSLRPLQPPASVDGSYGKKGKQNGDTPVDLKESLRFLAKLEEAPWCYNKTGERPRSSYEPKDGFSHIVSKDAPRFSYDGSLSSSESRDTIKSALKLKELPRLSLDSRDISMQRCNSGSKGRDISKDLKNVGNLSDRVCNLQQTVGNPKRTSNVVAKLMGLEAFPDSAPTSSSQQSLNKSFPVKHHCDSLQTSSTKANDLNRLIPVPKSPRSSSKEPISPRWKNPDLIMKPISKLPIEPAPWRQLEGSQASRKPTKLSAKTANPFPTVYSEIEMRLKDLEFNQSGKDLRSLKQILEAMQAKLLEPRKEEQGSNFTSQRDYESSSASPSHKPRLSSQRKQQNCNVSGSSTRSSDSSRTWESPIVIMKPAKLVQKPGFHASSVIPSDSPSGHHKSSSSRNADGKSRTPDSRTANDQSPRTSHRESAINTNDKKASVRTKSTQSSTGTLQLPKESSTNSVKSSGSVSPRLQQKKLELEKRSRPPTPPTDSNKPRRQSSRTSTEAGSPGGKIRSRPHKLPPSDDQLSQISSDSRSSSHQGEDVSIQSDNVVVSDIKTDAEVPRAEQTTEFNIDRSSTHLVSGSEQIKPTSRLEDGKSADFSVYTSEHPSPISVLDSAVYEDDELSPVKQIDNVPKGDIAENVKQDDKQIENQWNPADTDNFVSCGIASGLTSENCRQKLQNVETLVKKLRRLNSTHDEANTDYIASLCENTIPDHRYISEILLASGLLLRDLGSGMATFQLHPSGHAINPELFFVLEQTKASTLHSKDECNPGKTYHSKPNSERFHRKLIFDAVDEMIIKKLASVGQPPEPWLKSDKLAKKTLSAQKLLKELCSEIEQLRAKKSECSFDDEDDSLKCILWDDVMLRSESWTHFHHDLSSVVLDVERSIFKDLVDEIVISGGSCTKPARRRRLFPK